MGLLASIWSLYACVYSWVKHTVGLLMSLAYEFCSLLPHHDSPMGWLASISGSAMESILSSAVVQACLFLCGCIYYCIKSTIEFQWNLDALGKEMGRLIELQNKVKRELEVVEMDGDSRTPQVEEWLTEVEGIELKVNSFQVGITTNEENFFGRFFTCILRGRQVAKMLGELERLLQAGSFPTGMVSVNPLPKPVRHIPGATIEDQTTASKTLEKTINLLSEDGVRRIGIWGMGGVGKTTLVRTLNNKLKHSSAAQRFGTVIWVTVSKDLDLKRVQTQIAERLRVPLVESQDGLASRLYERLMKEKKYLLILDDVWETIDLVSLGVPQPEIHEGSKIILTSRSLEVCNGMHTDENVKVDVLNDNEAWQMFIRNAGNVANSECIKPIAKAVAKECSGLPLAVNIVGTAMRGKAIVEQWKDALKKLRSSDPEDYSIRGIEDKVYKPLKLSYDSLQGKNIKACFLYCSLYPEDYPIQVNELVQCWMAEGLIDEQNYVDSCKSGITIVEYLKNLCLLEPASGLYGNSVKVHDVVRDVAKWIAFSMEVGCKSLVRSGIGLSQISEMELFKLCKRISFANNNITDLPDCEIQCPHTSTLLLQNNSPLERAPKRFLQGFQVLRVLNISWTGIQSLPPSLTQLGELRALVLWSCKSLKKLPSLRGLKKLQVLNLCATGIMELPEGMEELSNLRLLNLSFTNYLLTIQPGVVSRLFSLEVLDMTNSSYKWGLKGEVKEGQAMFEELGCLTRLTAVYIQLGSVPCVSSEDLIFMDRLKMFEIIVRGNNNSWCPHKCDERKVCLFNIDLSGKRIRWLLINANSLVLKFCMEIGWMFEFLVAETEGLPGLKSLCIEGTCDSQRPFKGYATQHDRLPNLEKLELYHIKNLGCVWLLDALLGLRFSKLRFLYVRRCPKLRYLIPHHLIPYLINLEEIIVGDCEKLKNLFEYSSSSGQDVAPHPFLPKLRTLCLTKLPKLTNICKENEPWQSLKQVKVKRCNHLRRLPLTAQNANTIELIRGEEHWWSQLEWDDDHTKLALLPFFKPYSAS